MDSKEQHILDQLYQVILSRKSADSGSSYTASLLNAGIDKILKKFGEEATEVVIAGKGDNSQELIYESADLLYHWLVLLAAHGQNPDSVWQELSRRFGVSGLVEKASR